MRVAGAMVSVMVMVALCLPVATSAAGIGTSKVGARDAWQPLAGVLPVSRAGHARGVNPTHYRAFTLNRGQITGLLAGAPGEAAVRTLRQAGLVLTLPAPDGTYQRFAMVESPIMEPALAAKHPDVKTYAGKGIDDPTASIRADVGPLGFHASVLNSRIGGWYIDPLYHLSQDVYVSYFGRDLVNSHGKFVEGETASIASDLSRIAAAAKPAAIPGVAAAPANLSSGTVLRTYRLALMTDPSYATYFGDGDGAHPEYVFAAKVALDQPRRPGVRGRACRSGWC